MVQEEQLTNFIFQLSLKKISSLRIWKMCLMAKKVIKCSIPWLIHNRTTFLDPLFLS
jgi:hypothetical protein